MNTRRVLLALAGLLLAVVPAAADVNYTQGSGTVIFDFTCFTTKHCSAHVPVNSAGTEIFTAAVPAQVSIANTGANATPILTTANQGTSPWVVSNGGTFAVQAAIPTWGGGTLGAMANYGTSPGAVLVPGVNAFITNTNANGQTTMSASSPVVLPSNMAAIALWGQGVTGGTTPTSATAAGCNGVSAFPTAVTTGQMAVPTCDLDGTVITHIAPKARYVSGVTAAMTGTTSTQLIAAVASNKIYLTTLTCGNSHATVGTFVNVQDGSGGTTLWTVPAAAVYGGATLNLVPPVATTSGNAVFVADATTGANVICAGSGYSGP